jgi:glucose-6-phosphate-specific signal transduction histidine kinase
MKDLNGVDEFNSSPLSKRFWRSMRRDAPRFLAIVLIGMVLIYGGPKFALMMGEPAFAPWGLFIGGGFIIAALTHVIRRLLFQRLDLQLIALTAITSPVGAGLVFIGICMVLSAYVSMFGAMLRT